MQKIKYILVFLIAAYTAQGCSLKQYRYCELSNGKKCYIKAATTVEKDQDGDHPLLKRKYKNKGVQVFLPFIGRFSITTYKVANEFTLPPVQSTASFSVEYVQGKRGPPAHS